MILTRFSLTVWMAVMLLLSACNGTSLNKIASITSPDENVSVQFSLDHEGRPIYSVRFKDQVVIAPSKMGFDFKDHGFLEKGFKVVETQHNRVDETWELPWGEQRYVVNQCSEIKIELTSDNPIKKFNILFRAFNDGIGFRYEFPEQDGIDSLVIMDENTEFQLTGNHTTWWIPGDWDIYEHLYKTTKISEINAQNFKDHHNLAQTYIPENAVNTPVTMRTDEGLHLSFHEANLTNYPGMTLKVGDGKYLLKSEIVGSDRLGYKAKIGLPFQTPWRTIQIAEEAAGLIESNLILNLNEPNRLGDVSWFEPMKYVGIWWEMHIGVATWDYGGTQDMNKFTKDTKPHGKHGATTENTKRYIDFAAANNIKGILVEGWNTGWERWIGFDDREGVFDFVTPYPDYDMEEVMRYAQDKGVQIIMHHETSAAPRTYTQQLDTAFKLMQHFGMHATKSGYVGKIIPKGEYHHGQWMVNHYRHVLETAAKYQIAVNAHEPIKPTGIRRTLPNAISREGLRGQEFNAWASDGGNPPEHLPIVAFTRMLAGPIDFTPGAFDIAIPSKPANQVNTTLAQQLALYVVIYSPIQMACDLPQNYEDQPAFQFIRDVGVDWEQTKVLNGEIGDYVTIAREEKESGHWFVGSITDENERDITIDFSFLDPSKKYKATVYRDGKNAHYKDEPLAIEIESSEINHAAIQTFHLVPGGGLAISLMVKD